MSNEHAIGSLTSKELLIEGVQLCLAVPSTASWWSITFGPYSFGALYAIPPSLATETIQRRRSAIYPSSTSHFSKNATNLFLPYSRGKYAFGGVHSVHLHLTYAIIPHSPSTLDVHSQSTTGTSHLPVKMTSPPPSIASFIAGQGDPSLGAGSDEDQAALLTCLSLSIVSLGPLLTK